MRSGSLAVQQKAVRICSCTVSRFSWRTLAKSCCLLSERVNSSEFSIWVLQCVSWLILLRFRLRLGVWSDAWRKEFDHLFPLQPFLFSPFLFCPRKAICRSSRCRLSDMSWRLSDMSSLMVQWKLQHTVCANICVWVSLYAFTHCSYKMADKVGGQCVSYASLLVRVGGTGVWTGCDDSIKAL